MRKQLVFLCLLFGCHTPAVQAKESPTMHDADKLFDAGRCDSALQKYDALAKSALRRAAVHARACSAPSSARRCWRSTSRRSTACAPPSCRPTRGCAPSSSSDGSRCSAASQNWYGFSEETEEGAQGSAKLSKPTADREMETAAQALWKDRAALARLPLKQYAEFLVLTDADLQRYPSLWDFTVLRLPTGCARSRGARRRSRSPPRTSPRDFAAGLPGLQRLGALYEESGHLDGGSVDRSMAAERWRVARVMLGEAAGGTKQGARGVARRGAARA